jgi:hypothetical protein
MNKNIPMFCFSDYLDRAFQEPVHQRHCPQEAADAGNLCRGQSQERRGGDEESRLHHPGATHVQPSLNYFLRLFRSRKWQLPLV